MIYDNLTLKQKKFKKCVGVLNNLKKYIKTVNNR